MGGPGLKGLIRGGKFGFTRKPASKLLPLILTHGGLLLLLMRFVVLPKYRHMIKAHSLLVHLSQCLLEDALQLRSYLVSRFE